MLKVSVGIMAFNEEANIGLLLKSIADQKLKKIDIAEIIVVASGCTDATVEIVEKEAKKDKRIKPTIQKRREGKASAVNLYIKKAKSKVLVMVSADALPETDALEKLCLPFYDEGVGMTSAHIKPVNKTDTFMGYYNQIFWKLHHGIALSSFKAGEAVAWKNVIDSIDPKTSTDETNIAALILKKKLKTVYVAEAIVRNKGPETIHEFITVRRRHLSAYYHLGQKVGLAYLPPTMDNLKVLKMFIREVKPKSFKEAVWSIGVVGLEILA